MKKYNIKALAFDIGGVMASEKNLKEHYIPLCKALKIDLKKFYEIRAKHISKASSGKISGKEMIRLCANDLNLNYNNFLKNWIKYKKKSIKKNFELEKIIKKLKNQKYQIVSLSGVIDSHYKIGMEKKLYDIFQFNILSFKAKVDKPDIKIYKLLLKKLRLKPQEIIVIDDNQICLDSAKKLRLNTILFKNNSQFVRDLNKFGVKAK